MWSLCWSCLSLRFSQTQGLSSIPRPGLSSIPRAGLSSISRPGLSSIPKLWSKTDILYDLRAKTIKNKVAVNVELTAEEWRRRFEKERANNQKLRALVERCEAELVR